MAENLGNKPKVGKVEISRQRLIDLGKWLIQQASFSDAPEMTVRFREGKELDIQIVENKPAFEAAD